MTKRVVVTGAKGFLGQACVRELRARNWDVVGVSTEQRSGGGIAWRQVDLLDARATRAMLEEVRPSHLLHAAWKPVHGDVMRSLHNVGWLKASIDLAQAFHETGGQRFVGIGTAAEYDWAQGLCRNGVTPTRPATLYGSSKHALHVTLDAYARSTGMSFVWPRVFFVYGPGEHPSRLAASVVQSLLRGEQARCTHGRQIRDYLHVDDVASGIVSALESDHCGAIDIASGEQLAVRDLVKEIARQLGREDLVLMGARPSPVHDAPMVVGDSSQAEVALNWKPKIGLQRGIEDTIAWGRKALSYGILLACSKVCTLNLPGVELI